MKCRLCDRPTAAGTGKLCTDCAKALRRARGAEFGKLGAATGAGGEVALAPAITLATASPAPAARLKQRALFWAGIGVAALAAGYMIQLELATVTSEAPQASPAGAMTERVNVEPLPVVTRVEEPSWTVPDTARTETVSDAVQGAVSAAVKPPVAATTRPGRSAKSDRQDGRSTAAPLPAEHDVATPKTSDTSAEPHLAPAKAAPPAQPADGAQGLASAMQKCGNEGLISRFICEQKAYMQYCEDKWDKDPKCMRKVGER